MQLLRRNADGRRRGIQVNAPAALATSATREREALAARWQASIGPRLANRGFQLGGGGAETLGQRVDELLITRLGLASSWGRWLRLGRGYANRGATQDSNSAKSYQPAAE